MATLEPTSPRRPSPVRSARPPGSACLFWAAIVWMLFVFAWRSSPACCRYRPTTMDHAGTAAAYSMQHWLGTDGLGRGRSRAADLRRANIPIVGFARR